MSTRLLKESICDSQTIARLDADWFAEVVFCRVMVKMCDDYGRFEADPELVRSRCFPRVLHKVSVGMVQEALALLEAVTLVCMYEGPDGKPYGAYLQWHNHQRIRSKRPKYPPPPIDNLLPANGEAPAQTPADEEARRALSERVLKLVTWFYELRLKLTGMEASAFDGSHVHPGDRNAALRYFRMIETGQWVAKSTPEKEGFQERIMKALRHRYSKNIPRTFAIAVACFDDYIPQHEIKERGVRREERGEGAEYAEVEPRKVEE